MHRKAIKVVLSFFLASLFSMTAKAAVPFWMQAAAQQPAKTYADDVNSVVLLHEVETTVKDNGDTVTQQRMVIKVLRPAGRDEAFQAVPFDEETKLNYFRGWSVSAKGVEYEAKKDDAVEISASDDTEIYSDAKAKVIRIPGVDVGTVVGVEWSTRDTLIPLKINGFSRVMNRCSMQNSFCTCRQTGNIARPGCIIKNRAPGPRWNRYLGYFRYSQN